MSTRCYLSSLGLARLTFRGQLKLGNLDCTRLDADLRRNFVSQLDQVLDLVFDVVGHLLAQFLKTLDALLVVHESGEHFKEFLELIVFLQVFEPVKLGLVYDVPLEALEALLNSLLRERLEVVLGRCLVGCLIFGLLGHNALRRSKRWWRGDAFGFRVNEVLDHG